MTSWFKKRYQKAIDTAEELLWAGLIAGLIGLAWYFYEGMRGIPMYIAIGFFSALILTFVAALLLKYFRPRHTGKSVNEQHAPQTVTEKPSAPQPCTDNWLHDISKREEQTVEPAILVEGWEISHQLSGQIPFIDFTFNIFNGSVYSITIVSSIEGEVGFRKRPLSGNAKMINPPPENVTHASRAGFVIRQWVNQEEAKLISSASEPNIDYFYLNNLKIQVRGGDDHPDVKRARLKLPHTIPSHDGKGFIANITEQYEARLEALRREKELAESKFDWLREIVESDAKHINFLIPVEQCTHNLACLSDDEPYIEFTFTIFNGSVYKLSTEDTIQGKIAFCTPLPNRETVHTFNLLRGKVEMDEGLHELTHGDRGHFRVKQNLRKQEAEAIKKSLEIGDGHFDFDRLIVNVFAPDVEPQRLILMRGLTTTNMVIR